MSHKILHAFSVPKTKQKTILMRMQTQKIKPRMVRSKLTWRKRTEVSRPRTIMVEEVSWQRTMLLGQI